VVGSEEKPQGVFIGVQIPGAASPPSRVSGSPAEKRALRDLWQQKSPTYEGFPRRESVIDHDCVPSDAILIIPNQQPLEAQKHCLSKHPLRISEAIVIQPQHEIEPANYATQVSRHNPTMAERQPVEVSSALDQQHQRQKLNPAVTEPPQK
jgi:hypothetical protein